MSYIYLQYFVGRLIWLDHRKTVPIGEGLKQTYTKNFVIFGQEVKFNNLRLSLTNYFHPAKAKILEQI